MKRTARIDDVLDAGAARADLTQPFDGGAKPRTASEPAVPLNMRVPADDVKALKFARVEDGIAAVTRVKAMIALWRTDDEMRARIDALAATMKN